MRVHARRHGARLRMGDSMARAAEPRTDGFPDCCPDGSMWRGRMDVAAGRPGGSRRRERARPTDGSRRRETGRPKDGSKHHEANRWTDGSMGRATFHAVHRLRDDSKHHEAGRWRDGSMGRATSRVAHRLRGESMGRARACAAGRPVPRYGWTRTASSGVRSLHRHAPACWRVRAAAAESCRKCDPSRVPGGARVSQNRVWGAAGETRTCFRRDPDARGAACRSRGARGLPCHAARSRDAGRHSRDVRDRTAHSMRLRDAGHPSQVAPDQSARGVPPRGVDPHSRDVRDRYGHAVY